jgi:cytochrome c biogenesis protein CcdA
METSITSAGVVALLGLGFVFGLKHATEVDHVVAVSTIVSEYRNVFRSALVGGLWGAGHTASLVIVGLLVLVFRVAIPVSVSNWLEFTVALMIIALGVMAIVKVLRSRSGIHITGIHVHGHRHRHRHGPDLQSHVHMHFHEHGAAHDHVAASQLSLASHSHAISKIGLKPLFVGAVHGLAGSAALTLLVLRRIQSGWLGLLYLAVFGLGSTFGMLLMSGLIGLPFAFTGRRITNLQNGLQTVAGSLSIVFGTWYAYHVAIT